MRKILFLLLGLVSSYSFADDVESSQQTAIQPVVTNNEYSAFQQFDRQYSLGYGLRGGDLSAAGNSGHFNAQFMNFEVERLFDMGLWMDINAYMNVAYNQNPNVDQAVQMFGNLTGSDPLFGGLNARVGYGFTLDTDHLLIIPYGVLGRNTNYSSYTLQGTTTSNLVSNYYWTYGAGARLEYRLDKVFDFYLDQNILYNSSQANMTQGMNQADFYSYRTTLGAKFNVWRKLQLGAQTFYDKYNYTSPLISANPSDSATTNQALVPTGSVGGMVSVGLTY
jgi:hypothetical protein